MADPFAKQRTRVDVLRTTVVVTIDRPAERLRRWQYLSGVTNEQLAKRMGLRTGQAVSMLWMRAGMTEQVFERLCRAMEVEPAWWSEPLERWRRPRRGALMRQIDKDTKELLERLEPCLPSERRRGRPRS